MAKFNSTNKSKPTGKNKAGGVSYDRPIKKEIASVVLNSMLNGGSNYENEADRMKRIEKLIVAGAGNDAEFVAKCCVYTRTEGRLRSVSHLLAVLLIENVKGQPYMRSALEKTMLRVDDATEIVSLFNQRNPGKMIPNALRRAIKTNLEKKWDMYSLKKYAGLKNKVKMKNLILLAHPNPKVWNKKFSDDFIDVYKLAIEDNLPNISTAQTINAGLQGQDRVDAYMTDIKSGKAGYMSLVKNIRTLLENGISEADLKVWANFITCPKRVSRSMLLPVRFVDGWNACKDLSMDEFKKDIVKKALERAFGLSAGNTNITEDGEKVAILLDESGSMGGFMSSSETKNQPFYIGKVLASSMKVGMDEDKCLFYTWADTCTRRDIRGQSPFDFIQNMNTRGGGTDVAAPLKELIKTGTSVDKIVILSDMQLFGSWGNMGDQLKNYLKEYKSKVNPDVKVLFWNLQGYSGGAPMDLEKTSEIFEVSGYSDSMLKIIPKLWSDKNFLIKEIEAITL